MSFFQILSNCTKSVIIIFIFSSISYSKECLFFTSPKPGHIFTSPSCTLSLESTCDDIQKIELQARYFSLNSDTATIISIGTLNGPPYNFVWDISSIPDQLFAGVAFLAEAVHQNGEVEDARREGIFFAHQPVSYEKRTAQYNFAGSKDLTSEIIELKTDRDNLHIKSSVYWNEKDLTFLIDVEDPYFNSNISKSILSQIGVEIMLDLTLSRKPYPNKDVIAFTIPLLGIPYTINYKPSFDESGTFKLISSSSPCDFHYSVFKGDYKGYKIYFPIPVKTFGKTIPESLSCNIVLKVLNQDNQLTNVSWVKSNSYDIRSPYLWNLIVRAPKPLSKSKLLILSASFIIGLVSSLLIGLIFKSINKPKLKHAIEKTEAEQKTFDNLKEAIERQITYKNLTDDIVARELHLTTKKLNNLVKKLTGLSFHNYLMLERIEIAKERLRSSFCTETTIADACGFKDESEFEKYFLKFEHITPDKYRQTQQVT